MKNKKKYLLVIIMLVCICSCQRKHLIVQIGEKTTVNNDFGKELMEQGKFIEALTFYSEQLSEIQEVYGEQSKELAELYNKLGNINSKLEDFDSSNRYLEKAIAINEKINNNLGLALNYESLAKNYYYIEDYEKALDYQTKSLPFMSDVYGQESNRMATCIVELGNIYRDKGDTDEALDNYMKALEIQKKVGGETSYAIGETDINIGDLKYFIDDYDSAEKYYWEAVLIFEKELGSFHCETGKAYFNMGAVNERKKNYEAALEYYQKALDAFNIDKSYNSLVALTYNNIGMVYHMQNDHIKAIEYTIKACRISKDILPWTSSAQQDYKDYKYNLSAYYKESTGDGSEEGFEQWYKTTVENEDEEGRKDGDN